MHFNRHLTIGCALAFLFALTAAPRAIAEPPKLSVVAPDVVGLDAAQLMLIDAAVAEEIAAKRLPGCVVLIGRQGKIAFQQAYGHKQIEPEPVPMTIDTVFD